MPIVEEDIDGLSGLLFPFYDADTHMLYLAGKVSTDLNKNSIVLMTVLSSSGYTISTILDRMNNTVH